MEVGLGAQLGQAVLHVAHGGGTGFLEAYHLGKQCRGQWALGATAACHSAVAACTEEA